MRALAPRALAASRALAGLALACVPACADDGVDTQGDATTGSAATQGSSSTSSAGSTADTAAETDAGTTAGGDDPAWMSAYCSPVSPAKWLAAFTEQELAVVDLVNQHRAAGVDCGAGGKKPPAPPLTLEPRLHCAARVHSADMSERAYFDHVNPDGEDPFDRMAKAGYNFLQAGENIAGGPDAAAAAVAGWLKSPGHCANMMDPGYTEIGVGFYEGSGPYTYYWTQTFGRPQ